MKMPIVVSVLLSGFLAACEQDGGDEARPDAVQLEVSHEVVTVGDSLTYSWLFTDAFARCELDIDSDGAPDYTPDCAAGRQVHTFTQAGDFTATLTVSVGGQSSYQTFPVVTVNPTSTPGGPDEPGSEIVWRPSTPLPTRFPEAQGVVVDSKLYIFGGFDGDFRCCRPQDRALVFDPISERWQELATMPAMGGTGYGGVNHAGFATDGKDVYFAGGYTSNLSNRGHMFGTSEVWRYDVSENSYVRLPDLPQARGAGQLEYLDGKLYYFGGSSMWRQTDTGELFILDLAAEANRWTQGAPLPNPRNHLGSVVLGGKVYAIAGQHDHDGALTTQDDVHAYDPKTNTWEAIADLPLSVSHHSSSSFVMNGRIVVVGGEVGHIKTIADIFAYDPKTDVWSEWTPLPLPLQGAVVKPIGDKIIVAGGGSLGSWQAETYIGTFAN